MYNIAEKNMLYEINLSSIYSAEQLIIVSNNRRMKRKAEQGVNASRIKLMFFLHFGKHTGQKVCSISHIAPIDYSYNFLKTIVYLRMEGSIYSCPYALHIQYSS